MPLRAECSKISLSAHCPVVVLCVELHLLKEISLMWVDQINDPLLSHTGNAEVFFLDATERTNPMLVCLPTREMR